jgi:predicted N-acetyltransferase YhbS
LLESETLIIRQEKSSEFQYIYDFVRVAFETAKVSNGKEQDFVKVLRASDRYIPELALVAEKNAKIIGHIMLTKTYVATSNSKFDVLLLAPLSVDLDYRKRGVGTNLVTRSFEIAKNLGYKAVFVVGDPAFYGRFGFETSALFGIKHVPEILEQFIMVHELTAGVFAGITGTVTLT